MTKVAEFITITKEKPIDSYGFFSLGVIDGGDFLSSTSFFLETGFKCECTYDDETFLVFLYKLGITQRYIVISDFSKIPDLAVINNEEVLESLKSALKDYSQKTERESSLNNLDTLLPLTTSTNFTTNSFLSNQTYGYVTPSPIIPSTIEKPY